MKYERELTDEEVKAMEHYVSDVKTWIDDAITGKILSCQKRLMRQEITKAVEEEKPLPSTKAEILKTVFEHPGYKNRRQREDAGRDDGKPA